MKTYLDCWIGSATALFAQALQGEPQLSESAATSLPPGSFGFTATLDGEQAGSFAVVLDGGLLDTPLLGEGIDQKAGWEELLREVAETACGEMLASAGKKSRVEKFEPTSGESVSARAFQLKSAEKVWTILVCDEMRDSQPAAAPARNVAQAQHAASTISATLPPISPGVELLLDVELDASLRFGCREMPLSEILDLGPGDVIQLDRHVADPVDLIVGDKVVARGEVVLINGNFGLRVTEVAAPRKRLESIRCLF
jgi:flagellar motor switch protein FliN